MQAGVILDRAPIPAIERFAPDKVQGTGHRTTVPNRQYQQDVVAKPILRDVEKRPCQIGRAPFPRAGVLVEMPERIPVFGPDLVSGEPHDLAAETLRRGAFLADVFTLSRRQGRQERIKIGIVRVLPVKLLGDAVQQPDLGPDLGLLRRAEGDVQRRHLIVGGNPHRAFGQCGDGRAFEPRTR